ncbi:MAG: lamin tail domain-containing protein [Calditrichae bacterium]|nr:lamin tail domain-containing protein [Calditrichia bacterium]
MKPIRIFLLSLVMSVFAIAQDHILITEIVVTPTDGEFIEITNPTGATIDLSNYYLTDATSSANGIFYYNIVTGSNAGGGSNSDFHARFPDGASIAPGEFQLIALSATAFNSTYSVNPTYEMIETDASVPNMREAFGGSIAANATLSNAGEIVILYSWDGQSDLVQDVDYVVWGDKDEAVDKTGVSIDGPDADTTPSTYLADTGTAAQISIVNGQPHDFGESTQRTTLIENGETASGGNGITGNNETSEDLATSFSAATPNPGSGPSGSGGTAPVIGSVSRDPLYPFANEAVTISADITDDGTVASAQLFVSIDGGTFNATAMSNTSGNTYTATIPGQPGDTEVQYYLEAMDDESNTRQTLISTYDVPGTATQIADIQSNPSAYDVVLVEAIVTLGAGITIDTRTDAYVQDESGRGINIFSQNAPDPLLVRGNRVQIIGRVTEFGGVTEIIDYSIQLVSTGNPLPSPLQLSTGDAGNIELEGSYVRSAGQISEITPGATGTDIIINDGSGALTVRVWNTTGIDLSGFAVGEELTVTAVMDIFNSASQLTPGYADELVEGTVNNAPVISNILQSPANPASGTDVSVQADITDDDTVSDAKLFFAINSAAFDSTAMSNTGGDTYAATIAGQAAGTTVEYYIKATDNAGETTLSPTNSYTVVDPQLNQPPEIVSVTQTPTEPDAGQDVQVIATITDDSSVPVRQLFYAVDGAAYDSLAMNFIGADRYAAFVPGQAGGATVDYFVKAIDDSGATALSDTFSYTLPSLQITAIADIQANPSAFTTVTVEGIITLAGGTTITTRTDAYIQDESGRGINLFSNNPPDALLARGNRLRITGTVEEFQGVTEITDFSIELISTGNALPEPLVLSTSGAGNTALEGTYVQTAGTINNIASFSDATNITINDGSGDVLIRIWGTTGIDVSSFSVGQGLTVTAVMDIFSGAAQLAPSVQSELVGGISGNIPPVISNIGQSPTLPKPDEAVTISADVTDDSQVSAVRLLFSLNSAAFDSVAMSSTGGDSYQAQISGQPDGTNVTYFVRAIDDSGAVADSPNRSFTVTDAEPGAAHLLITELAVVPTEGEFVEIFNPTGQTIDLSDYYLTDATFPGGNAYYYNIVTGENAGGGTFGDFHARFPNGATIAANEVQTIAMSGTGFISTYSVAPTYELFETDGSIPNMREAFSGSIAGQGGLTNTGEMVVLYYWDGQSDLVQDADYLVWGDKAEGVDKSGVSIDGPDADSSPSTYLNDTPIASQISASADQPHGFGETIQRTVILEYGEVQLGGNGITGHNEMSENLAQSFVIGTPNPGEVPLPGAPVVENVAFSPAQPTASDAVTVTAEAVDTDGSIASATLNYSVNGGVTLSVTMENTSGNTWSGEIPAQLNAALVQFSVTAIDNEGKSASNSGNFYVVGAVDGVLPIATIQDNVSFFDGQQVTIEGVVTLGASVIITTRLDAYIQDESGKGINLFNFDPPVASQNIDRFKKLRVSGTVTEFSGVTEITDFTTTLMAENAPLPAARFVRSGLANEVAYEGTYTRVVGEVEDLATGVGGGTNITLRDEQGTVLVRVWDTTELNISGFSIGDTISVQGVADVFNNTVQIVPGYQDEIIIPGKTARADGSGLVQVPVNVVQTDSIYQNFTVNLFGTIDDTISTVQIELPSLWGQVLTSSVEKSTVQATALLNGNPVPASQIESGSALYSNIYVRINDVIIENGDTLSVSFEPLAAPSESVDSYIWVRTAGNNGSLRLTERPGRVTVGSGGRQLIYDLQTDSRQFSAVNLRGTVTIGVGLLRETVSSGDSVTSAYVQDESGRGVQLFRFGWDTNIQRGNLVRIIGSVTEFNGVTEVEYTSSTLIAEEQPLPAALPLSNSEANSTRWDGTLVATEGVVIEKFSAGGGSTLEISDGRGSTSVRVWDTARLDLSQFNVNDRILAEGVSGLFVSQGDSIFQLLTTYQDQIRLDPDYNPSLDNVSLRVEPHPFVPDRGETIEISYNAAAVNNQVTVRIFDLGGRLVSTLLDETAALVERTFEWNGRDELNELVPLGTYVCHLEVIEPVSGKKKSKLAPIVVGTVLK